MTQLVDRHRIVTLTGPGGIDKTRLAIERTLGDPAAVTDAPYDLGFLCGVLGGAERAEALLSGALDHARRRRDRRREARVLFGFHVLALVNRDWEAAEDVGEQSMALFRTLDDQIGLAWLLFDRGGVALSKDPPHPDRARAHLEESPRIFTEMGDLSGLSLALSGLAGLASFEGDHVRAARLTGARARMQRTTGADLLEVEVPHVPGIKPSLAALGEEAFWAAAAEGELMSTTEAVVYAGHRTSLVTSAAANPSVAH